MKSYLLKGLSVCLIFFVASLYNVSMAQVDNTMANQPDTTLQEKGKEKKEDDRKRRDEFIVYAGVNFNNLAVTESEYNSTLNAGYHLGGAYKRGKFFYWQAGARFNNAIYKLEDMSNTADSAGTFAVRSIDVPLTGGINLLSATNRILALRLFISLDPSFALAVGDNDLGFTKDNINSFILYGQAGIGVNVAFVVLEVGYNYGFQDLFEDMESKPGQLFVNLGFRF